MNKFSIVFWLGLAFLGLSAACYSFAYIAYRGRVSLRGMGWKDQVAAMLSHLPDDSSPAWPHVGGGVFGCTGLALFFSGLWDFFDHIGLGAHLTLEISNLFFALFVSGVAFWTLWQTKRIEQNQGVLKFGFLALIEEIAKEIERLTGDAFDHPDESQRLRILLITTNPFFGLLSYPNDKITDKFESAMKSAARRARTCMRFEILCGDGDALNKFHEQYYKSNRTIAEAKTQKSEKFVAGLIDEGATIYRVPKVPEIQFAVIGNVLLEFILDSGKGQTEIRQYRRTQDTIVADRFQKFFGELREALTVKVCGTESTAGNEPEVGGGASGEKKLVVMSSESTAPADDSATSQPHGT